MYLFDKVSRVLLACLVVISASVGELSAQNSDGNAATRLYQSLARHFGTPLIETRVGDLRDGGSFAEVIIADSAAHVETSETRERWARQVAQAVRAELRDQPDLRRVIIGWKSVRDGVPFIIKYSFELGELTQEREV